MDIYITSLRAEFTHPDPNPLMIYEIEANEQKTVKRTVKFDHFHEIPHISTSSLSSLSSSSLSLS